jgi:hypothetical protein
VQDSVCRHDKICSTYGPTSSQAVPRLTQRISRGGVLVLRLSWGGNRTVSPRRGSERIVAHSGHSTLATPASRMAAGTSVMVPRKAHLVDGAGQTPSPTGSRAGARAIRCLWRGDCDGGRAEDARGGRGGTGSSSARRVEGCGDVSGPRAEVPSNACNC